MKFLLMLAAAAVTAIFSAPIAQASVIFGSGLSGGSGDVQNVLLVKGQEDTSIYGYTNNTDHKVVFSSDELLFTPAHGQDRIGAVDGSFNDISFHIDPLYEFGFSKAQFSLDLTNVQGKPQLGSVELSAIVGDGTVFSQTFSVSSAGQHFFTIEALLDQIITQVVIRVAGGYAMAELTDLSEVRLAPIHRGTLPEPSPVALLGVGLLGLGLVVRRRQS